MDVGRILLRETGTILVEDCYRTTSPWERFRGLIGRGPLSEKTALLLDPSDCIHTFFMRHPIDLVYLDENLVIMKTVNPMKPWRISAYLRATSVLALKFGAAQKHGLFPKTQIFWSLKYNVW